MESPNYTDVRRFARFPLLEYAMVHLEDGSDPFRAMVVDIGLGGAQLRSKEKLPAGAVCTLEMGQDENTTLSIRGEVRFSAQIPHSDLHASGFKFMPEDHVERTAIAAFVHYVFQLQAEEEMAN